MTVCGTEALCWDAVNPSVSVLNSVNILTEDKHLHQRSVKNFMEKLGLKIIKLDDFYSRLQTPS